MKNIDEMIKRREAVESAIKSLEMEGFEFTESELKDFDDLASGKITFEQHRQKYIALGEKYAEVDHNA